MSRHAIARLILLPLLAGAGAPLVASASVLQPSSWAPVGGQANASFGSAVAPAGDVNGDGYSDLLVGAPDFDGGFTNGGAAFLHLGGSAGLVASSAWQFLGTQAAAATGFSVAPAGDVNGDGYGDLIVGAPLFNGTAGADAGRAYVFLGSATGPSLTPSQTFNGAVASGQFGRAVACAGDVNADGYDDVLIGAPSLTSTFISEGAAYLYHGGPGGLTGPVWTRFGGSIAALMGYAVSGAGDVDADGDDDVIVGAPGKSVSFTADGAAFVYLGAPGGVATSPAASLHGPADSSAFGAAVSRAGDVNGDGYADVLIGAPNRPTDGGGGGWAGLYAGAPGGLGASLWQQFGSTARSFFGVSVATAGDLNGDGRADFVVGADRWPQPSTRSGQAFVYLGTTGAPVLDAQFDGTDVAQALGFSVATAGDVDGDGFADLALGEPGATVTLAREGRVTLYRGSASKPVSALYWPQTDPEPTALFGLALAGGVDPYGQGSDALVASAPYSDQGFPDAGRLRIATSQVPSPVLNAGFIASGDRAGALLGNELARAGDVNGDGREDLIAGSPRWANGQVDEGIVQVFYGTASGFAATPGWSYESNLADGNAGRSVAGADFNGDGFADVAAGFFTAAGPSWDGTARVFYGSASGPPASPSWTSPPVAGNTWFGFEVATGDWDADGYTDLAVGAPNETHDQVQEGRVHVFFGGPGGLDASATWILEGDVTYGAFGYALANAGDADGDGVGDLLVGSPGAGGGRAWIFRGSRARSTPLLLNARLIKSDLPTMTFGNSVCGIGDIDKDGFADFLVGTPQYSNGQLNEGRVSLYRGSIEGGEQTPWWTAESNVVEARFGTSLARTGDPNADGWPDFAIGSPYEGAGGTVHVFEGGGRGQFEATSQMIPGGGNGYLWMLGTSPHPSASPLFTVHSPAGRVRARQEVHIGTQNETWGGGVHHFFGPYDTGAPQFAFASSVVQVTSVPGLVPGIAYRWRTRTVLRSPYFPHGPWVQPRSFETGEQHFRVAGAVVAVGDPGVPPATLQLASPEPSPFRDAARIRYRLPHGGSVAVDVYDARGRHVRRLVGERQPAGEHDVAFDGRDGGGRELAGGIYFVALDLDGARDVRKVVRLP